MANQISASGSGLDIPSLVSQLVQATRTPTETRINSATKRTSHGYIHDDEKIMIKWNSC